MEWSLCSIPKRKLNKVVVDHININSRWINFYSLVQKKTAKVSIQMISISEAVRVKRNLQYEMCAHPIRTSASNLFDTASSGVVSSEEKKNNPHQS